MNTLGWFMMGCLRQMENIASGIEDAAKPKRIVVGEKATKDSFDKERMRRYWELLTRVIHEALELVEMNVKGEDVLTDKERGICKAMGATYVTMDDPDESQAEIYEKVLTEESDMTRMELYGVKLWKDKPEQDEGYFLCENGEPIAMVDRALFPSVKPGDVIYIGEAISDGG